ncbi:hypothetical protein PGT21_000370 [Puccinia graminis f. sp. tritici]|uniref:Uncharacterized protein n=1 Tax=Puccinia graminis f. sp. tritici TaxID=56615 RepID=A0A5B0M8K8_PUCGR|nr:hypothetical protein PGT21_000370 [Puccinia graminis f. sp. tritici]
MAIFHSCDLVARNPRSAAPPSPHPSQGEVYLSSTVLQYSIWSSLTQDLPVPPSPPPSQVTDNLSSQFKA